MHSFACTPCIHPLTEWTIPVFSFTDPGGMEGWIGLGGWLHTEIHVRHRELNPDTVNHPSTNRARRRLTSLIGSKELPLRQTCWFWIKPAFCLFTPSSTAGDEMHHVSFIEYYRLVFYWLDYRCKTANTWLKRFLSEMIYHVSSKLCLRQKNKRACYQELLRTQHCVP